MNFYISSYSLHSCLGKSHDLRIIWLYYQFYRDLPVTTMTVSTQLNFNPPKLPESVSSLSVEFHVLLSKVEWFWNDSAKVYLCFGHSHLGNFMSCYGPMTITE